MAPKATDIYRSYSDYFDEETAKLLREGATPLDYPYQVVTNTAKESAQIQIAKRPYMIVASNGMLTGGRVVGHLRHLIDDPGATLLFVGYQGEGTLGAHLQAGATTVKPRWQVRQVRCRIRSISGFSAHADESELLDWIGRFAAGKRPGDPASRGRCSSSTATRSADRARAEGPRARLRDARAAMARARDARLACEPDVATRSQGANPHQL
jgi:predicted metal-dependent RNase